MPRLETDNLSSISALPLISSVALDKVLNFSIPQFPHLKNKVDDNNKNTYFVRRIKQLNGVKKHYPTEM